jgi:hypothetical protein
MSGRNNTNDITANIMIIVNIQALTTTINYQYSDRNIRKD